MFGVRLTFCQDTTKTALVFSQLHQLTDFDTFDSCKDLLRPHWPQDSSKSVGSVASMASVLVFVTRHQAITTTAPGAQQHPWLLYFQGRASSRRTRATHNQRHPRDRTRRGTATTPAVKFFRRPHCLKNDASLTNGRASGCIGAQGAAKRPERTERDGELLDTTEVWDAAACRSLNASTDGCEDDEAMMSTVANGRAVDNMVEPL